MAIFEVTKVFRETQVYRAESRAEAEELARQDGAWDENCTTEGPEFEIQQVRVAGPRIEDVNEGDHDYVE